jgi:adsorption protein B
MLARNRGGSVGASGAILGVIDTLARETMLFASIGFLIGGIDDVLVDLAYVGAKLHGWLRPAPRPTLSDEAPPLALFIPAWDEAAVIGPMLRAALTRYDYSAYRIYVGVYPNDAATIAAVHEVAKTDARVRLVIGDGLGPTTKADCLNTIWRAPMKPRANRRMRWCCTMPRIWCIRTSCACSPPGSKRMTRCSCRCCRWPIATRR